MSFYGRIDHVADNISFVTDKIYDNRYAMDRDARDDKIYVGRYVLIEYGQNEDYDVNYNIDKQHYPGMGRGYDSTVWQKVFVNNVAKYVMVAELNSVVPTLDLTVDAPTHEPVVPHFDSDSNPVYYKLHVQPNWGFRVKNANKQTETSDGQEYPSDIKVKH